jgi:hypothetical protein
VIRFCRQKVKSESQRANCLRLFEGELVRAGWDATKQYDVQIRILLEAGIGWRPAGNADQLARIVEHTANRA